MNILKILLLSVILLEACNANISYNDDNIPSQLRNSIGLLNKQLVEGISNNQTEKVFAICSDDLLKSSKIEITQLLDASKGSLNINDYKIKNEFYIKGSKKNVPTTVMTGLKGDQDYQIVFNTPTSESYISVIEFNDKIRTIALTSIYGKFGDDWKLNNLRIGEIKYYGLNAIDWFNESRDDLKNGFIVNAANKFQIATKLAKPAEDNWIYVKEKELSDYKNELNTQIHNAYSFPMELTLGTQSVSIINISPQILSEGCTPLIRYVSKIDISDTLALSKECDKLDQNISEIFKGIKVNNKAILYRVFNKIPNKQESEHSYGFVRLIK